MDSVLDRWPAPSMCLPVGQWTGGCPGRGVAETILPEHQEHPPESHAVAAASPLWSKDPPVPATQRMLNTTYCNHATLGISVVLFLSHLPMFTVCLYYTIHNPKFGVRFLNVFVSYAYAGCIYRIKNAVK